jgi:outer membrane lipoprotein-sorting protein
MVLRSKKYPLIVLFLLFSSSGWGEEPRLQEIIEKVHRLNNGIEDETAGVNFRTSNDDGIEKKSTHRLYWKNLHGKKGLANKFMLLTISPPNLRGEGFLVWQGQELKNSQGWLYLPELRQVRRIDLFSHAGHHHNDSETESDLLFGDMANLLTGPGGRRAVGEETIQGEAFLVIEEDTRLDDLAVKHRLWVSTQKGTIHKIEHLSREGKLLKTQWIEWQEINGVWLWKATEIHSNRSGHKTMIELSDVQINTGLSENLFTDNFLRSGRMP